MTTTTARASTPRSRPVPPGRAGVALPTRQRRPGWTALALTLVVAFGAVGAWLYSSAGSKTAVVVVVREVPAGHVIDRADVSTVAMAGAVTAVAGERLDSVVGQTAAVHLLPNMLLQRSMVTAGPGLTPAQAHVGVAVRSGQIPADGLAPGDAVTVVELPAPDAPASTSASVLVERAEVFAVREDPAQAGGTLLTLVVPTQKAVSVAAASGAGRAALIRVAPNAAASKASALSPPTPSGSAPTGSAPSGSVPSGSPSGSTPSGSATR